MVLSERKELLRKRQERQQEVRLMKVRMARSILRRIEQEVAANPEVHSFTTPLLKDTELARYQLRSHPDEIAGRIALDRTVEISLDEKYSPPMVTVTLGPEINNEE